MSEQTKCWTAIGDCGHFTGVVTESADDDYAKRKVGEWAYRGDTIETMTCEQFRRSGREMCDCDHPTEGGQDE